MSERDHTQKPLKITVAPFITRSKSKPYRSYKYRESGAYITALELEEHDGKIKFVFGSTATPEDYDYVNKRWEHKL